MKPWWTWSKVAAQKITAYSGTHLKMQSEWSNQAVSGEWRLGAKRKGVSTGQREAEIHKVNTLNAIAVILDGWHRQRGVVNNNGAWGERVLKLAGFKQHVAIPQGEANTKIPTVVPTPPGHPAVSPIRFTTIIQSVWLFVTLCATCHLLLNFFLARCPLCMKAWHWGLERKAQCIGPAASLG